MTTKQQAITDCVFRSKSGKFTIDINRKYIANNGETAYYVTDSKTCAYTESVLMTCIYRGYFKQNLTDIKIVNF